MLSSLRDFRGVQLNLEVYPKLPGENTLVRQSLPHELLSSPEAEAEPATTFHYISSPLRIQ